MQKVKNDARSLLLARIAVSATFFSIGALFANWVSRIPEVKEALNLSESTLGLALMVSSVGVIFGLLVASGLIARFGSKTVCFYGVIGLALALGLISFVTNFYTLAGALFFAGFFNSMTDVAMNAQGVEVELRRQKPIMNSFHAFWSVGLFSGAVTGSAFVALGFSFRQHFLIVPIFFIVMIAILQGYLLTIDGEQNNEEQSAFQLPPRAIWGLGALAFAAGLSEGAIIDWGGLYLHDVVGTTEAVAALGLAAFSATMVAMRFAGDKIAERVGAVRLVRVGAVGVVLGVGLAIAIPTFWTTVIGFSVAGIGLAVAIPLAFSAAGKLPDMPSGRGIAGVATIGYAAFLIGPPIIGFIAEATSLRFSFIIVMVLASTMLITGGTLNVRKAH